MAVYVVAGVLHKNNFHIMYLLIYRYDQLKRSKDCELFSDFDVIKFCCIKFLYTFAKAVYPTVLVLCDSFGLISGDHMATHS